MKFKRQLSLEYGLNQIAIVPLIGLICLLLIFFVLISSFVSQTGIKIALPRVITSEVSLREGKTIVISRQNIIYFNGRVVTLGDLEIILKVFAKKNIPLLIKADRRASFGTIGDVWDLCRAVGVSKINIATSLGP